MLPTVKHHLSLQCVNDHVHCNYTICVADLAININDMVIAAAVSVSVNVEHALQLCLHATWKLWRTSVCTFRKSTRRVTERPMAESKKRTGTSIPWRFSDFF